MAEINGGRMVVNALEKEGVTHVFSISGGHIAPIYDALLESNIKLVTTRHEQAAAMMAGGWARTTGEPGVCIVTAGPGFTNAITGMADAHMACTPVVCIAGTVATDMNDRLDLQDLNQLDMMKPITNWARTVIKTARIPESIHEAFKQARGGSPGPVFLEVPADILGRKIEDSKVVPAEPIARPRPGLAPEELDKVVEMIRSSKKPILIAGSGVYYARGAEDLVRFAEKAKIPTFTTGLGKGCIRDDHPLGYGTSMALKPGAAIAALTQADLIFLLGTRISLFFLYGRVFNPAAKMIHLNIDPMELGRNRVPDLGLVADAGRAVSQLADAAEGEIDPAAFDEWRATLDQAHKSAMEFFRPQVETDEVPMHPLRLCKEVEDFLGPDDIMALDGGDTQIWMGMVRSNFKPGTTLESGLFGCLGVGIPFGIAAALANPDRNM